MLVTAVYAYHFFAISTFVSFSVWIVFDSTVIAFNEEFGRISNRS